MTRATLIKEHLIGGLAYSFRGSVHYHHGGEQCGVLANEIRVLLLD